MTTNGSFDLIYQGSTIFSATNTINDSTGEINSIYQTYPQSKPTTNILFSSPQYLNSEIKIIISGEPALIVGGASGTYYYKVYAQQGNYYTNLYIYSDAGFSISVGSSSGYNVYVSTPICFKKDTKILCLGDNLQEEYKLVQDMCNGTFVKTYRNGFRRVSMIGKTQIYNPSNNERDKCRLFVYKKEKCPELIEDLVLTGGHSVLTNELTERQREGIIKEVGEIFITDNKYRLMAFLDEMSEPYEIEGMAETYHFSLETDNIFVNYGVYANGLLAETCSEFIMEKYQKTKV